jgi:branched-chain amino acid transport system permease protein
VSYWLDLLTLALILGTAATVIAYLADEAGMIHSAGAALMGVGGYTSALATRDLQIVLPAALALTLITGFVSGTCLHVLTRRLRGAYLALVTLGAAVILHGLMLNWVSLTGGPMGLTAVPSLSKSRAFELFSCLILAGVTTVGVKKLPQTAFGLRVRALRDDELLSEDLLLHPQGVRFLLFVGSSCALSLLGGLYAHHLRFVDPSSFALRESISILAMGLVVPISVSLRGLVGGLFFIFIPELLRLIGLPAAFGAQLRLAIFGLLLLIVIWNGQLAMDRALAGGERRA